MLECSVVFLACLAAPVVAAAPATQAAVDKTRLAPEAAPLVNADFETPAGNR